jgi:hypothetical protein
MQTWYVRVDGSLCDPAEVETLPSGLLRPKSGEPISYGPHGPRSRGVTDEQIASYRTRDVVAGKPQSYKTRQAAR